MHKRRFFRSLTLILAFANMAGAALALGLGAGPAGVVLGQALDFAVAVRLDNDETLNSDCVQAEVLLGDQRVAPASVRTRVNSTSPGNAVIRVSTTASVDEPVVTVQISAGCSSRVNRRYVVFADPVVAQPAVVALPVVLPLAETVAEPIAAGAPAGVGAGTGSTPNLQVQPPRRAVVRPEPDVQRVAATSIPSTAPPAVAPSPSKASTALAAKPKAKPQQKPPAVSTVAERPRLRLDVAEAAPAGVNVSAIDDAIEAVAQAASAARSAAAAASASAERIAILERSVEAARKQALASEAELARLRTEISKPSGGSSWLWPVVLFAVVVALAAAWLAWRLRAMRRAQEAAWLRASNLAAAAAEAPGTETSPLPLITSALTVQPPLTQTVALQGHDILDGENARALQRAPHAAVGSPAVPSESSLAARSGSAGSPVGVVTAHLRSAAPSEPLFVHAMERTVVLPPSARFDESAPRDVSIEELIDVDQQAEFFIALGQDTAAIDLLVAHLRNTGGGSPLTYLKLLEIYHRRDDEPAYERTRSRFNQRYNAYAPEWGADLTHGKSLEDYPDVSPRLQQAWARPLDAMAELEALLFRKSRGELFDLPAYREVLFLYSLARDLLERESSDKSQVDLLLPLDFGQANTGMVGDSRAGSEISFDDHPTAPVDLDLTPPKARESIFGELLSPSSTGGFKRR